MNIVEFFDPTNEEHVRAYKEMEKSGVWPEWFYDANRDKFNEFDTHWSMLLHYKIARYWIDNFDRFQYLMRAESMWAGDDCEADGDGPCGACRKCCNRLWNEVQMLRLQMGKAVGTIE